MSIPVTNITSSVPSVLSAGGNNITLAGVILSEYALLPFGQPVPFANYNAVAAFFGANSVEAGMAQVYFTGYDLATTLPKTLYFARYANVAIGAFLSGVTASTPATLAALQLITPAVAAGASIALTVLTVPSTPTGGVLVAGQVLTGTAVTAGTKIVGQLTGPTGGAGTYTVDTSQTTAATAITGNYQMTVPIDGANLSAASLNLSAATSYSNAATLIGTALSLAGGQTCTYSAQLAAFVISSGTTGASSSISVATGAGGVALGLGVGATVSQGSVLQTPQTAMTLLSTYLTNWAAFTSAFEPIAADKMNFSSWTSGAGGQYVYVAWDSNTAAATQANNAASYGATLTAAGYAGTVAIGAGVGLTGGLPNCAAFVLGTIASLNFGQKNGRATFAFLQNPNVVPTCTDATSDFNLRSNGYNHYGNFATSDQTFNFFWPGTISGAYKWIDPYVNAIYFGRALQDAVMTGFTNTPDIPYNAAGYTICEAFAADTITGFATFGGLRTGITLSAAQIQQVNSAAGVAIDTTLFTQGYYLRVGPATPAQRAARSSPPGSIWFTDGGAVQQLNFGVVDIQ